MAREIKIVLTSWKNIVKPCNEIRELDSERKVEKYICQKDPSVIVSPHWSSCTFRRMLWFIKTCAVSCHEGTERGYRFKVRVGRGS
jgi:hypothetical protein